MKNLRLIPLVVIAALGLLIMKTLELFQSGSSTNLAAIDMMTTGSVAGKPPGAVQANNRRINLLSNWSVEALTDQGIDPIVTGSESSHEAPKEGAEVAPAQKLENSKVRIDVSTERPQEAPPPVGGSDRSAETKILQLLGERRKQIDAREHEVDIREGLLKATESKIEQRIDDLKVLEDKIGSGVKSREEKKVKELADLVKMYESMKAKDAARVFDKLDSGLLVDIARQMNPKKLGDVVSKMSPETAQKLTVGLANRQANDGVAAPGGDLPKIEGHDG